MYRGTSGNKLVFLLTLSLVFIISFVFGRLDLFFGVENCGYFLSLIIPKSIYILLSIILILVVVVLALTSKNVGYELPVLYGMIAGGGVYNTFERAFGNCVTDYINFILFKSNFADLAITVAVLTLAYKLCIKPLMPNKA